MTRTTLAVSVVICAYTDKRWDDLLQSVASIRNQTYPVKETILVIDHNSTLFTRAQKQFPDLIVIENKYESGNSAGRNTGIERSTGDVVAFIDEDAVAAPDWVENIVKHLSNPKVFGAGGFISPIWAAPRPRWFPDEFLWVVGSSYRGMPTATQRVRNLIGTNMAYRRELFKKIGGFRTDFGHIGNTPLGCDETEFCIRANREVGSNCLVYDPAIRVQHRVPAARTNWKYFMHRCYSEGMSKANLTQVHGGDKGLSTESNYVLRTLPSGVLNGLVSVIMRGDIYGFGRAVAITFGLFQTLRGYIVGKISKLAKRNSGGKKSNAFPALAGLYETAP
jgi:GT2 family glycosyltransferase